MPSQLAQDILKYAGEDKGERIHASSFSLLTPTTIDAAGKPATIHVYKPWEETRTSGVLRQHVVAVWDDLHINIVGGPGLFGTVATLYCCWGTDAESAPTTLSEMAALHDFRERVYGGLDNQPGTHVFNAVFNESRSDVLKMRYFPVGGRIVFYYCFIEEKYGATQLKGDRFLVTVRGRYHVYGNHN